MEGDVGKIFYEILWFCKRLSHLKILFSVTFLFGYTELKSKSRIRELIFSVFLLAKPE